MPPPIHIVQPLETERLALRPFEAADFEALADLQSRPEVTRYLYWEPRTRRQVKAALRRKIDWTRLERETDVLNLAVVLRDPAAAGGRHELIGDVLLTYSSAVHQQAELGYVFHPDWHGHGYASEATTALVDLAFSRLGVHRVFARLDARNTRSARLLERIGLRKEAHLVQNEWVKGEWTDEAIYGVLADEWKARPTWDGSTLSV